LDEMALHRGVLNLDGRAQNAQLRVGVGTLAVGLAAAMAMNARGAGPGSHLVLVPVFFVGAYGICAGLSRTCGFTAITGRRITATGSEPIADRHELAAVRRRGGIVMAISLAVALIATMLLSLLSR
jgi:hypothetical protein